MQLDNSDGFWSWMKSAYLYAFIGLAFAAVFVWGAVIIVCLIGLFF